MTSYISATYLIKTKTGQKGPFTHQQICKLVVKGKLEQTVSVREVESNTSVLVADIVSGAAYRNELEEEALGIASDLMEEVEVSGYASGGQLQKPVMADEHGSGSVSTNRHRQTKSQKRRSASSRIFESEISEGAQRTQRVSRKSRNKQSMLISGVIAAVCILVGVIVVLIPQGSIQGVWRQDTQVMTIGATVLKIVDGSKTIIHDSYQQREGPDGIIISAKRFDDLQRVEIKIISISPASLTTSLDGAAPLTWTRQ